MSNRLRYWAELKTTDFADAAPDRLIALLPVAAVEQHGPHLPLGTDALILDAVLTRLAAAIGNDLDILVLPMQEIGDSLEHTEFPGTLSQPAETLIASWTGIGRAVAAAGLRKLAIVNSHGGQPQLADIVAQRLRAERKLLVRCINSFLLGTPDGLFGKDELAFGLHGGEIETSIMLAIAPHLVDMAAAENFPNLAATHGNDRRSNNAPAPRAQAPRAQATRAQGDMGFAWQAQDLNPAGVTGNAAAADAERGAAMIEHLANRVAEMLTEMAALPYSVLRDGPK